MVLGLLMNSLLKPLSLLNTSLREINSGEGNLTRRLTITSNDEIGELSQEFNRFLQTLQERLAFTQPIRLSIRAATACARRRRQAELRGLARTSSSCTKLRMIAL